QVLFTQSANNEGVFQPEPANHIPGLEALKKAELLILAVRFLDLPDDQMQLIDDYLKSGRPVLGIRTSNHGFKIPTGEKWEHYDWQYEGEEHPEWHGGFGQIVFGGKFIDHHGHKKHNATRGLIAAGKENHGINTGLVNGDIFGPSFVYGINVPLRKDCEVLVHGQVLDGMEKDSAPLGPKPYEHMPKSLSEDAKGKNDPLMPLAWTSEYRIPEGRRGIAFHTNIGASQDFAHEGTRKHIVNGVYWLFGITPPQGGCAVDLVGDYQPTEYKTKTSAEWLKQWQKISDFQYKVEMPEYAENAATYLDPRNGREGKVYAKHPVNRFRLYDFYSRQAEALMDMKPGDRPTLYPDFPALDAGRFGHWGAYHKNSYDDQRENWAQTSSAIAAAFNPSGERRSKEKFARTIAFRLAGDVSCVFDSEAMNITHVWNGGFVRFAPHRWGLGSGMHPHGSLVMKAPPATDEPERKQEFLGYYQHGEKNVIAYKIGNTTVLEHPWASGSKFYRYYEFPMGIEEPLELNFALAAQENQKITTQIEPSENWETISRHLSSEISETFESVTITKADAGDTLLISHNWGDTEEPVTLSKPSKLINGGPDLWEWKFEKEAIIGIREHDNYAQDSIPIPDDNPYGAPMILGGLAFFDDGRAAVSTFMGDVWIVDGLKDYMKTVTWKRFATGLNHALGLEVIDDKVIVLGRDRLTRLHDLNGDGMADFYENFSEAFAPSHGGHSFYVGLQKDREKNLYFTGSTHTVKVSADGKTATYLNEGGQRNPNGVGASQSGIVLTSANEGDWTPASLIWEVQEGDFCGRNAKEGEHTIAKPMVFVPRGIDNSTGSQIFLEDDRWGMPRGTVIGTSFGNGTIYSILRDPHGTKRTQAAVSPLPFDFASGTHRGRFAPHDGQLYLVGSDGWGNYAIKDGHFDRIRYTGGELLQPVRWHAHENGIAIELGTKIQDWKVGVEDFLVQQWHYQFSEAYGCRELSFKSPGTAGHDPVEVSAVKVSEDGKTIYLSIPDIHPVECMHIHARLVSEKGKNFTIDTFHTILHLDEPTKMMRPRRGEAQKELELDVKYVLDGKNLPWTRNRFPEGTSPKMLAIESLAGLKFDVTQFEVTAGEPLQILFKNVDPLMPHNLVFCKPNTGNEVGLASNQLMIEGNAAAAEKHYVSETEDVLYHTPVLVHNRRSTLYVNAPEEPGEYPYLCTFPGHWGVMKGIMKVLPKE
ncbi:MAG: DUF6797 domain-containing protein, partial [Verrucomicrobiota bacterium]